MNDFFNDVLPPCFVAGILIVWFSGPLIFPELYVEPEYPDIGGLEGFLYIPIILILVSGLGFALAGLLTMGRWISLRTFKEVPTSNQSEKP